LIPPVTRSLLVPLEPALAFDLFVRRLPEWWPLSTRSVWLERALACRVDARLGGRIIEEGPDGAIEHWGTFVRFNEASDILIDWHPGLPADSATQVEVHFRPAIGGTLVELEHRNWEKLGARGDFVRSLYANGWAPIFARFARFAASDPDLPPVTGPGCIGAELPPGRSASRAAAPKAGSD
jgi:hypothetical protein